MKNAIPYPLDSVGIFNVMQYSIYRIRRVYPHTVSFSDFIHSWASAFITAWRIIFIAILIIAP